MTNKRICYCGDDDIGGAAIYLSGVMTHGGMNFDRIDSNRPPGEDFTTTDYDLYVLSDYPRENFREGQLEHIVARVAGGAGLLMIGGWESFHGRLGEYHNSPLVEPLPVVMLGEDDRRNYAQPCLIHRADQQDVGIGEEILNALPWNQPPGIGGFNLFEPKPDARTLLETERFEVTREELTYHFHPIERVPLLVVGTHDQGRVAALATDVAPHWVGGFVDWGNERVVQDVGDGFIDVGSWYAQFFRQLLTWTGQL